MKTNKLKVTITELGSGRELANWVVDEGQLSIKTTQNTQQVGKLGRLTYGMVSSGQNFQISGYEPNPNFEEDYDKAVDDEDK